MCTAQGEMGPRRKPEMATETEAPRMEGRNQIRSSRRRAWMEVSGGEEGKERRELAPTVAAKT
jgi:hypothetical protein